MNRLFTLLVTIVIFNLSAQANNNSSKTLAVSQQTVEPSTKNLLPVYGFTIKATNYNDKVEIWWRTETEVETKTFEVERSSDGIHFTSLVVIDGAKNSNVPLEYKSADDNPSNGLNFYRVKETSSTNVVSYSAIAKVKTSKDAVVKLYPNPVHEKLTIQYDVMQPTQIKIIDLMGRTIKSVQTNKASSFTSIDVNSLAAGTYTVVLYDKETIIQTQRILKQ